MPKYRLRRPEELSDIGKQIVDSNWYQAELNICEIFDLKKLQRVTAKSGMGINEDWLIEVEEDIPVEDWPTEAEEDIPEEPNITRAQLTGDAEPIEKSLSEQLLEFSGVHTTKEDLPYETMYEQDPCTDLELETDGKKFARLNFTVFCKAKDLSKRIEEVKMIIEATLNSGEESKFLKARL